MYLCIAYDLPANLRMCISGAWPKRTTIVRSVFMQMLARCYNTSIIHTSSMLAFMLMLMHMHVGIRDLSASHFMCCPETQRSTACRHIATTATLPTSALTHEWAHTQNRTLFAACCDRQIMQLPGHVRTDCASGLADRGRWRPDCEAIATIWQINNQQHCGKQPTITNNN